MIIDQRSPPAPGGVRFSPTPCATRGRARLSLLDAYVDTLGPDPAGALFRADSIRRSGRSVTSAGFRTTGLHAIASVRSASTAIPTTNDRTVACRRPTPFTTPVASPTTTRWQLPLPDLAATRAYLAEGLAETLALLATTPETDDELYFFRLVLFHEDMHTEAAIYMAQALGIPLPAALLGPPQATAEEHHADHTRTDLDAGLCRQRLRVRQRACRAHGVDVAAVDIDATVVTWDRYLPFIEATGAEPPRYLRKRGDTWQR